MAPPPKKCRRRGIHFRVAAWIDECFEQGDMDAAEYEQHVVDTGLVYQTPTPESRRKVAFTLDGYAKTCPPDVLNACRCVESFDGFLYIMWNRKVRMLSELRRAVFVAAFGEYDEDGIDDNVYEVDEVAEI